MSRVPHPAAPGRWRRLALTAVPPLLLVAVPTVMVPLYRADLPERAHVGTWADTPQHAPTWEGWLWHQVTTLVMWEILLIGAFAVAWRVPQAQRIIATMGCVAGVSMPLSTTLEIVALAHGSRPAWHLPAEIAVTAGAVALGWMASGPAPAPPRAVATPPPHLPAIPLRPAQRAMFAVSTWSARRLATAALVALLFAYLTATGLSPWQGSVLLAVWAVLEAAQAYTRLCVGDAGITVACPWLPGFRRAVPYEAVRFAEARSTPPRGGYRMDDGRDGWGMTRGKGPALALELTDGRRFVYSTRSFRAAETAAALVNGMLNRSRYRADHG